MPITHGRGLKTAVHGVLNKTIVVKGPNYLMSYHAQCPAKVTALCN